jgi:hypothetical protein
LGRRTFSEAAYTAATEAFVPRSGPTTRLAEQVAHRTGKLDPLVDPAGFNVIRRSLIRFEERPDGLFEVSVGMSIPCESRVDTTGSMGNNVDVAIRVLPDLYKLLSRVLPGFDVHVATGIFGDAYYDQFALCRPQFEMEAEKIVKQLTLMVPERNGGDSEEDPHYGIFGGAYLVAALINRYGLKRYDFTISDAPAHDQLDASVLRKIFGDEVFDKVKKNGFDIDPNDLPSNRELVQDLLKQAHAFFLQVGRDSYATRFWTQLYGPERVVQLPRTELLPQVQATIVGLTEGTLGLSDVRDFLRENNVNSSDADRIVSSVSNIPIGAQVPLREGVRLPQKGDLFRKKPDVFDPDTDQLQPLDPREVPSQAAVAAVEDNIAGPDWL